MTSHPTIREFKRSDWKENKILIPCSVAANPSVWQYDIHGDLVHVNVAMRIMAVSMAAGGSYSHNLILTCIKPFHGEVRGL